MAAAVDVMARYPSLRDAPCRYPDARPAAERRPYVYQRGWAHPLGNDAVQRVGQAAVAGDDGPVALDDWLRRSGGAPLEARVPVLAVGSNAYPRQLADKFLRRPVSDDSVVTLACTVRDARIVFCASLSVANGYIPVSLQLAPGAVTRTWLQWLTAEQLAAIAETEGPGYALVECGSRAGGGRAVAIDGVADECERIYGWTAAAVLRGSRGGAVVYAGNPVASAGNLGAGLRGDREGIEERALLGEMVARFVTTTGRAMTWDGCSLPERVRRRFAAFLAELGAGNPPPPHWPVIDRDGAGFAQGLIRG